MKTREPIRFRYDERKGLEVLIYVAERWPGVSPDQTMAVLLVADHRHLNENGRPITGDTYVAGPEGPMPIAAKMLLSGDLDAFGLPEDAYDVLDVVATGSGTAIFAKRTAERERLSPTDEDCLEAAIAACRAGGARHIPKEIEAMNLDRYGRGDIIDPADFVAVDHPHRRAVLREIREFAAYGVL
jgi:hypothetical protein